MQLYIRKLNAHELGYRKGQPNKAGAFFLITKKDENNFFPEFHPLDLQLDEEPSRTVGILDVEIKKSDLKFKSS